MTSHGHDFAFDRGRIIRKNKVDSNEKLSHDFYEIFFGLVILFLDLIRENHTRFCHKILDSRNCYYPRTQIEFVKETKKNQDSKGLA